MCESCVAEVDEIGEFLPGFFLVRSSNNLVEGFEKGKFGIVIQNGPSFIFSEFPKKDPDPDNACDDETGWQDWTESLNRFKDEIEGYGSFNEIYDLVAACIDCGYITTSGSVYFWLFDHLGKFLETKSIIA
jgi:hypothetical protein